MMEITETAAGLRAVDAEKNEVTVRAPDWERGGTAREIDRRVDETISGYAKSFLFPEAAICVESEERDQWRMLASDSDLLHLEHDDHVIHVETDVKVYVHYESNAVLSRDSNRNMRLSFPDRTAVTIGFRSPVRRPIGQITVPPTPEGVAAAITHLAAAHQTTSPDRSYPSLRAHPPLVEVGDEFSIPDAIRDGTPETGIALRLPEDFASLFVAAPLAYYLQAKAVVEDRPAPLLEAPGVDLRYEFPPLPDFQDDAAATLCRVFFFDCLVRNAGPYGVELAELPLLDEVGLDAGRLYDTTPQKRLEAYVDAPYETIEPDLPDWHLSMYVQPTVDHIATISHLLDRLGLIYLPETTPLEGGELVKRSLRESYRSSSSIQRGQSDELLLPTLRRGRVHGWIAEGFPIDAFKSLPEAYENRLDYHDRSDGPISLILVLNDPDMDGERSAAARIYQERAEELSIDLNIHHGLTRSELADVFEHPTDFVHYIGHCDEDGLRCTDGNLSVTDLRESSVQTFFLNACGSYREGLELIRKGSVAGAVTLHDVLDEQATKVGTTFARLLVHGLSIEQALRTARRRAIVNKNYAVVGDGTYTIPRKNDSNSSIAQIKSRSSSDFIIKFESFSPRGQGCTHEPYLSNIKSKNLLGNVSSTTITRPKLLEHLRKAKAPIIYDGKYYWSDDLWEELSDGA